MTQRRLFISAGEDSGDMHAARLIAALQQSVPNLLVEGLGGQRMREAGCQLQADLVASAVMGFSEVLKNLRFFRKLFRDTVEHLRHWRPDALVLVDYPGLNLRLAAAAKKLGITTIYYISPQVWAWRPGRIKKIARVVDKMLVILPFEEELYRSAKIDVTYVGHPLLDNISETGLDDNFAERVGGEFDPLIGLLPGSRKQEITVTLPVMLETARIVLETMPRAGFLIPCSNQHTMQLVKHIMGKEELPVRVFEGGTYDVAKVSRCCIVASGTATLEVACFLTPLIVVYRTGRVLWFLGRRFLRVSHISLVNILAGREVVPELLQDRMRPDLVAKALRELCDDGEKRSTMVEDLRKVRNMLGSPGASRRAADVVAELLSRAPTAAGGAQATEQFEAVNG
ncbi:MAG: lipid-A-disaccharide synthase [Candidatus Abyssubacteria bacterium]